MNPQNFFLGAMVIIITLSSCKQNADTEIPAHYSLVKFTNPEYKNYVIVSDYETVDHFILMRGNRCVKDKDHPYLPYSWDYSILERPHNPYWELPDGWFLIDWAWIQYPLDGDVLLSDISWDRYDGHHVFDKSEPHIKGNIFEEKREVLSVDLMHYSHPDGQYIEIVSKVRDSLGNYVEKIYPNEAAYHRHLCFIPTVSDESECLCENSEEKDNFWSIIQSQLAIAIENGDLDKITYRYD